MRGRKKQEKKPNPPKKRKRKKSQRSDHRKTMAATHKCEPCGKNFASKFELKEHCWSLLHHIKLEQKNKKQTHCCDLCSSTFPALSDYSTHLESDNHRENAGIWDQMKRAEQEMQKNRHETPSRDSTRETPSRGRGLLPIPTGKSPPPSERYFPKKNYNNQYPPWRQPAPWATNRFRPPFNNNRRFQKINNNRFGPPVFGGDPSFMPRYPPPPYFPPSFTTPPPRLFSLDSYQPDMNRPAEYRPPHAQNQQRTVDTNMGQQEEEPQDIKRQNFMKIRPKSAPNLQLVYVESSSDEEEIPSVDTSKPSTSQTQHQDSVKDAEVDSKGKKAGDRVSARKIEKRRMQLLNKEKRDEKQKKSRDRRTRSESADASISDMDSSVGNYGTGERNRRKKKKRKSVSPEEHIQESSSGSLAEEPRMPDRGESERNKRRKSQTNYSESRVVQEEADSTTSATPVEQAHDGSSPKRPETSAASKSIDKQAKWDRIYRKTAPGKIQTKSRRMFKDRQSKYRPTPQSSTNEPDCSSMGTDAGGTTPENAGDSMFVLDRQGALPLQGRGEGEELEEMLAQNSSPIGGRRQSNRAAASSMNCSEPTMADTATAPTVDDTVHSSTDEKAQQSLNIFKRIDDRQQLTGSQAPQQPAADQPTQSSNSSAAGNNPAELIAQLKREAGEALRVSADDSKSASFPPPQEITQDRPVKQEPEGEPQQPTEVPESNFSQTPPAPPNSQLLSGTSGGSRDATPNLNPEFARENVYVAGFSIGSDRNVGEAGQRYGESSDVVSAIRVKMEALDEDDVVCLDPMEKNRNEQQNKDLERLWELCEEEEKLIEELRDYDARIQKNRDRMAQLEQENLKLAQHRNRECLSLKEIRAKRRQLLSETGRVSTSEGNEPEDSPVPSKNKQLLAKPPGEMGVLELTPVVSPPKSRTQNFPGNQVQNPAGFFNPAGSPVRIAYLGVLPTAPSLTQGLQKMVDNSVGEKEKGRRDRNKNKEKNDRSRRGKQKEKEKRTKQK